MENTTTEKTYSQMREEFDELYTSKIVPIVQKHEAERKKNFKIFTYSCGIFFIASCIMLAISDKSPSYNSSDLIKQLYSILSLGTFTVLVITGCIIVITYINKKKMEHKIKEKIMPIICNCFGNMKWSYSNYKDGNFFIKSCVIPSYTLGDYDDIFKGSYKDVDIEIIESRYPGHGKIKGSDNMFSGLLIKLDMNKDFNTHTVLLSASIVRNLTPSKNLHYTELEDVKFNKKFDVFTDNELEARYLLTPSFMEKLKNISLTFNTNRLNCAFFKSYLVIAIHTFKDLFSIGALHIPITDKTQYSKMCKEIISIIKLIDHFKLDQK